MAIVLLGIGLFGLFTSGIFLCLVLVGAARFLSRRGVSGANDFAPAVSLLKPLHGTEFGLEENLESFFRQDYPAFEILFCARDEGDAGLATARSVAARFPNVPVQFLVSGEPQFANAKVFSLRAMERAARHDIFVVSDSDVRVGRDYLRRVVAPFSAADVGAVTCLYRGVAAEGGFWARLEAAGMSIEMPAGVLVADMLEGMKFTLGPTMAMRRECVAEIGGFTSLGQYCADDFVLGDRIAANGHRIVLSDYMIDHIVLNESFLNSVKHQVRWMTSTRFSRPKGHFGTALTFSVPYGVLAGVGALLLGRPGLGLALFGGSVLSRMLMAAIIAARVVRKRNWVSTALLFPVRDFMGLGFWAASYGGREIIWRGEVYRLEGQGRMVRAGDKS